MIQETLRLDGRATDTHAASTRDSHANPYRRDIDGLRAIAVVAVILFHAGVFPFKSGFAGVDIFFVISGFLIGGIVYRDVSMGRFRFADFYLRRAKRIVPALVAVTLTATALAVVLLSPTELRRVALSAATALVGVSNIRYMISGADYFSPDTHLDPLLMTWSLGVEEQFYLLFPLLLLILRRFAPRATGYALVAICVSSFVTSIVIVHQDPNAAFYLLPTRACELGLGALLAVWQQDRRVVLAGPVAEIVAAAGLLGVLLSLMIFDGQTGFPGFAALLPVLGTILLLSSEKSGINRRLLSCTPFVGIGLISYSWYLWHWPLMAFVRVCMADAPSSTVLVSMGLISLVLAYFSWKYVEKPFRRTSLRTRPLLPIYAGAIAACVCLEVGIGLGRGLPSRFGVDVHRIESVLAESKNPCLVENGDAKINLSPTCVATGTRPRIALLGDSHAAALATELKALAEKRGFDFEEFTKAACPSLVDATVRVMSIPSHASECAEFNRRAIAEVLNDKRVRTVFIAGYWSESFDSGVPGDAYIDTRRNASIGSRASAEELREALTRTERAFVAKHMKVIVAGDVPRFTFDPAKEVVSQAMPIRRFTERLLDPTFRPSRGSIEQSFVAAAAGSTTGIVRKVAGDTPGVTYISLWDNLCDRARCRFSESGTPLYTDPQHLSNPGAFLALSGIARYL